MGSNRNPYRKLTHLGKYTYYITLPPEIVRKLGWRERQKLTVRQSGKRIVIQDWKP